MYVSSELNFFILSIKVKVHLNLIIQANYASWSHILPKPQAIPGKNIQILVKCSTKLAT